MHETGTSLAVSTPENKTFIAGEGQQLCFSGHNELFQEFGSFNAKTMLSLCCTVPEYKDERTRAVRSKVSHLGVVAILYICCPI
jgi:hypothetical protein